MDSNLVQILEVEKITPYARNPRKNDEAVATVKALIAEFGFLVPILIDAKNVVIAGHTRLKAALELGLSHVPAIRADHLTPEQVKAFRILENKSHERAMWDAELLKLELSEIEMSLDEFDVNFDDLEEPPAEIIEDELPPIPKQAVSRKGDIWLCGRHRIMCGDCTVESEVVSLIDGDLADCWLTDPPYGVAYVGKTSNKMKIENDALQTGEYRELLGKSFRAAFAALKPGGSFYIFHADSRGLEVRTAVFLCKEEVRQCLIWNKNSMVLGRQDYQWKHEPCLYGWKHGASHGWYSDRKQTTVLEFDRPSVSDEHPTTKPVGLFAYLIGNSTAPQGKVFDGFLGSGTTLLAAEQLGRTCYGMEVDPIYVDVILARYRKFTNLEPTLQGGRAFEEVAKERAISQV